MPTFIEKSCCRGIRPSGVVGTHHNLRSDITGHLLRDRHVPRYLIAPTGFGKSACAYEYAQVVFGFEGVFWVRCESPCFIRDLDNGTIADQMASADPNANLVVFDDVPHLDQVRTDAFDSLVGELLDSGLEMIVCLVPSADTLTSKRVDKTVLRASDLLATDDELEVERMRGNIEPASFGDIGQQNRAACMVWGDDGCSCILKGIADEEIPSELELMMLCMLAMGSGQLEALDSVIPSTRISEDATYLAEMFPYLGIDIDLGSYECLEASIGDIIKLSRVSPDDVSASSLQGDRDEFAKAFAEGMLEAGDAERATDFLRAFASRQATDEWTADNGWKMLARCDAAPVAKLLSGKQPPSEALAPRLAALRAWAFALLGDEQAARRAAKKVLRAPNSAWEDIAAISLMQAAFPDVLGSDSIAASIRSALLAKGSVGKARQDGAWRMIDAELTLRLEDARTKGPKEFLDEFERACESRASALASDTPERNSMLASCALFLESACRRASKGDGEAGDDAREEAAPLVAFFAKQLEDVPIDGAITWPEAIAANSMLSAIEAWPYAFPESLSQKTVAAARSAMLSLMVQSDAHKRKLAAKKDKSAEYQITHEDPFRAKPEPHAKAASLRMTTPTLYVSLFGGLEAWIGAERDDVRLIKRKNAKVALAILSMNRGREVTKERMCATIWPDLGLDAARQNLYVVWAYLKKVLKVGSSCPYLISTQTGYKLDHRIAKSDIEEYDELCKGLMFGHGDKELWEEMYEKVTTDFAEDLLPEVEGNPHVESIRSRLRTQLVDGLVEASARMWRDEENRGAIWFAREALRRDRTREDAYIALMEAQIASMQRAAALDTYFECRRALSEQLGIDPSRRVVELYRSIIETEEDF